MSDPAGYWIRRWCHGYWRLYGAGDPCGAAEMIYASGQLEELRT